MKNKFLLLVLFLAGINTAFAQTTEFIYQGRLLDGSLPPTANYDFEFRLFAIDIGGPAIGTIQRPGVQVSNGTFTVKLDYAGNFNGLPRWLEIAVKPAGSPNPFVVLNPRQPITSAPYSIRSLSATTADNSFQLGGTAANQFVQTSDTRLSDARDPLPNSPNYINNTTATQASSNFNVSGNGTLGGTVAANVVSSATQFNIGSVRVLGIAGTGNVFVGSNTGTVSTGSNNSFVGAAAGAGNTSGGSNSFFGTQAGASNSIGNQNAFFGRSAGFANTSGGNNAFFGNEAGAANTTAVGNSFFGYRAGFVNTASGNSFFGNFAGASNTTATNNSFFGNNAGISNQSGANNAFFGGNSGASNTTGARNSFFGQSAGNASATASDNTFFGYNAGLNSTAGFNTFFGSGSGAANTTGGTNSFFGYAAGTTNTIGTDNSFFGRNAGHDNSGGDNNTFVGLNAGSANTLGSNNTAIGANTSIGNLATFATAVGAGAVATTGNAVVLGRSADTVRVPGNLSVTGNFSPGNLNVTNNLVVAGPAEFENNLLVFGDTDLRGFLQVAGRIVLDNPGSAGTTNLCRNLFNQIALCSSSLRYKNKVQTFFGGLDIVRRLRPISFSWKDGGARDVGFGAEEVEKIEPLLTTRNDKGEIEGVKYDQITTVLVNSVKEQQEQIERQNADIRKQQEQIKRQQDLIEALRKLVCQNNSQASVCREDNQ